MLRLASSLSRRRVLRGMLRGSAVALGLPLFESMLNESGTALAAGSALPVRYGLFFWGNGLPWTYRHRGSTDTVSPGIEHPLDDTLTDKYTPTTQGKGFAITDTLKPLERHLANINVVTGLEPHTAIPDTPAGQSDGHMRGICVALTADQIRPEGFDHDPHIFAVSRATLDQYIAKHPQFYADGAPLYHSLELGMSSAVLHDFGTWNSVSHNGPNSINPPQRDPQKLFDQLFSVKPDLAEVAHRTSVLDVVSEDARQLSKRLGKRDRDRLDEHLTHLAEIERRLNVTRAACTTPAAPTSAMAGEPAVLDKLDIMADILVAALRCDMTRVFTIAFTTGASLMQMNGAGEINGAGAHQLHDACHGGERDVITGFTKLNFTAYAKLLDKLTAEQDVNGQTLLDSSVILGTSEYGEGFTHSNKEHPFILAGKASGRLDTGWHVRDEGGNMARVHLTVLRALGLEQASYGFNGGESSDALPFLVG
ncbi:MAG TPA: DUF1552 domain-containing protein [Polyangiaceae bacterium]|nr:DUF1552 domain-containing protein [Polyangiaceae bacterium]